MPTYIYKAVNSDGRIVRNRVEEGNKITRSEPEEYPFGTGMKQIQFYKIQRDKNPIEFPYIEEIMLTFREWDTICSPA